MLNTESALRKDKRTHLADMQHRHFATIATILRDLRAYMPSKQHDRVVEHFADKLRPTNSHFDRARFLKACED